MIANEPRHTQIEAMGLRALALDRRGRERVRAVLNVLTEATFFYKEDDPDLFFFLCRNQAGASWLCPAVMRPLQRSLRFGIGGRARSGFRLGSG